MSGGGTTNVKGMKKRTIAKEIEKGRIYKRFKRNNVTNFRFFVAVSGAISAQIKAGYSTAS
jgi:hypothetical protein